MSALAPAAASSFNSINNVVVVGGTHGNEYTGVWCIKELAAQKQSTATTYPSLQVSTLLGNPEAHKANKRFIESDLNREFAADKLLNDDDTTTTKEGKRAREIDQLLGPKFGDPKTDVIVDLHTTTTNMGLTLIVPQGDTYMTQAAAYIRWKCGDSVARILMHPLPDRKLRPNLCSTARHGLTIEVGPVPTGLLRHDAVDSTNQALHAFLEFLERQNRGEDIMTELKQAYPSGEVPCFRSAPAKRQGEMSGKIPWPSDPDNENFPAYLVHKSVQDKDFCLINTGDPLFRALDGSIIPYNGSHGDQVYLIFVNEGGYYYKSSGTGIGVAVSTAYDLLTGKFCKEEVPQFTTQK